MSQSFSNLILFSSSSRCRFAFILYSCSTSAAIYFLASIMHSFSGRLFIIYCFSINFSSSCCYANLCSTLESDFQTRIAPETIPPTATVPAPLNVSAPTTNASPTRHKPVPTVPKNHLQQLNLRFILFLLKLPTIIIIFSKEYLFYFFLSDKA